jgi:hypothetical protein
MMRPTAAAQLATSSNTDIRSSVVSGSGTSRNVTSTITPSIPSEPQSSAISGSPGTSPAALPVTSLLPR